MFLNIKTNLIVPFLLIMNIKLGLVKKKNFELKSNDNDLIIEKDKISKLIEKSSSEFES